MSVSNACMRGPCATLLCLLFATSTASAQEAAATPELQQAQALFDRADALNRSGQFADAVSAAEQSLAIREKLQGVDHPDLVPALNLLGRLHRLQGDFARAEPIILRGLRISEHSLGSEHRNTLNALIGLALLHMDTGAYGKAEPIYLRVLAAREQTLGPEHPDTALVLNNLANLHYRTGDYAKALPLYRRALAIREKSLGPEHTFTADSVGNLGLILFATGAYADAEPLYRRALAIREKVLGPEHPNTAYALNGLALFYKNIGNYAEAEPLLKRAIEIYEKTYGPENPTTADALESLAILYFVTGVGEQAQPLFERALAINEKSYGPEHPDTARSLTNLGELLLGNRDYAAASLALQRALDIKEKSLGPEHPHTALSLNALALALQNLGERERAKSLFARAVAIEEKVLGVDHPDTADTLHNLAQLHLEAGEYADADTHFRRSLAARERTLGPDHPSTALTLQGLAAVRWAQGNTKDALPNWQRAQAIQEKNSERFLLTGSEARKAAFLHVLADGTHRRVSFALAAHGKDSAMLGMQSALQYKGRALDAMSDSVSRLRRSVRREDRERFAQLEQVANQMSTLVYQGLGSLSIEEYRRRLIDLSQRQDRLESELSRGSAEFRSEIGSVAIADIARTLPRDAVLVEWFRYEPYDPKSDRLSRGPRYAAFVLTRAGVPVAIDVGDADAIDSAVQDLRAAFSDPRRVDATAAAATLSARLLRPLRDRIKGYKRVLMSPDGALNVAPMAALMDAQGEYLAHTVEITYLTSARDLLKMSAPPARGDAVLVADPDYGARAALAQIDSGSHARRSADFERGDLTFDPLVNTALEVSDVKQLLRLDESKVWLREAATEANLKRLRAPRILHIATHGFFLADQSATLGSRAAERSATAYRIAATENPLLRSGIALAGANARRSGEEDGILTALEAAQLDLHGTELVVLSACDSGIGAIRSGEGVYGLRRALVLAGAQTQIASLWKVSDEATRELMVEFYRRLLKGEGRSAALRGAQRALMAKPEWSHPYYWASFVPIGNWLPLTATL